jgi:hypothetical protein
MLQELLLSLARQTGRGVSYLYRMRMGESTVVCLRRWSHIPPCLTLAPPIGCPAFDQREQCCGQCQRGRRRPALASVP